MQQHATATGHMGAATSNQFGADAVVATTTLAGYVTGVSVSYSVPSDSESGGAAAMNGINTGDGAFQNFAGLQSLNMNTGVGASQNSAVTVSVSAGDINLGQ
ncbi:MAG: hypothetical protein IT554_02195 [Sphingomonadaceae bacterium]|nr:hypothetical protein [Sphingomonadaceae bacterium]